MKNLNPQKQLIIYQAENGKIEFKGDFDRETIWATQKQIAEVFSVKSQAITKHINNIYQEGELQKDSTCSVLEQVQTEGERVVVRKVKQYNLDMIISVGYRVNSKQATQFRIWATRTLKQHLIQGYTINKKLIGRNYEKFMQAVSEVKALLPPGNKVKTEDIIELINAFAGTWVSLDAYDSNNLPQNGLSKKEVLITVDELTEVISQLKHKLINKNQATDIFAQERSGGALVGIVGSVFQSIGGKDAYPTTEEKSAHLLYFIVKNHPFVDGNKRSGAFAFVWFLQKAKLLRASLSPEALTALTLLIAESNPKDKPKMIGLILLLLR